MIEFLVFNKSEWINLYGKTFNITEEDLNNADEKGFIKKSFGVDCYLSRPVEVLSNLKSK